MIVAVLQLSHGSSGPEDVGTVGAAIAGAAQHGATLIVCSHLPSLASDPDAISDLRGFVREVAEAATVVLPCAAEACGDLGRIECGPEAGRAGIRSLVVHTGDRALDPEVLARFSRVGADALVWQVEGESALQVEAIREYAIAASETVSSLVLVASRCGADQAIGGSAIVYGGDILAEAGDMPETLIAEIPDPLLPPERPGAVAPLPPLLAQRLAAHKGERVPVDYPADPH